MTFDEVLAQVQALLQQEKRLSYRGLKRRFALDDEYLEDLKEELIGAKQIATDEDGRFLVWAGVTTVVSSQLSVVSAPQPPGPQTPNSELRTSQPPAGERRQLTVLFCDLVGSTALSEQLDPEDYRAVVQQYQQTCTEVIQRHEGYLAQYLGDGLLVYFGYPTAHEDEARRAVRTGLEIVGAIRGQVTGDRLQRGQQPLQVRIGIHTGLVVVGEIGSSEKRELLALGETPNIAARLQSLAEPDTVVLSAVTQRLSTGLFECRDLGPQILKGISTPLSVYQVIGETTARSRFDVAVRKGLTPLVGREEEIGLLRRRWEQAKDGAGQVVLLSGEPGIGKSRLMQALTEHILTDSATRIEFRCSAYHQNSAFYPILEHLQRFLAFTPNDTPQAKLAKLQQTLAQYRFSQADTFPLLAALLSLPHPDGVPPLTLSPQKQKQKTQEALVAWLIEEAEKAAVYCAWEDLHWADPSTLEVLTLFLDQVPTARLLATLTFRPEFTPPWKSRSHISHLALNRLGRPQVEAMVEQVTGGNPLPKEVVQQIVNKTDGVPLFVEELTKTVLESVESIGSVGSIESIGSQSNMALQLISIPTTLQDSLMARLDRLGTAKEIAQLGATLGREFNYELLHAVSPIDEEELQHRLKKLVEAELIYQRGVLPQAHYLFKHALIQDTAYQSLLKSKRQQYHRQIAKTLEEQFPQTVETQPEFVAYHYTEAGLGDQAIPYWQQAGQKASQRSAYVEAITHLTKGLELLKSLPEIPERIQQELVLHLALYDALVTIKGYTAVDVEKTVTRSWELCQQVGETPQLFPVLWRLLLFYMNRGELQTTLELSNQMLRLAQSVQDQYLLSVAHMSLGKTLYLLGELTSARPHLEQGITLYDPQTHPRPTVNTADPRMDCNSYLACTMWHLGYPEQALKRSQEAVALATELSHPFSLAYALGLAAWFHVCRRDGQLARDRAEAEIALSTEQGFPYWLSLGTMMRGWALAEQGQIKEGIAQMHQSQPVQKVYLAPLTEIYGKVGQVEAGLSLMIELLAYVDKTGTRVNEAELYRLKGELTLQEANQKSKGKSQKSKIETSPQPLTPSTQAKAEAEACFQKAIEISRKQQAKSLELRATTSLARLWQQQDKQKEAHDMLAEIYNWFTEGFDTKDLQEAKELIEELSH